MIKRAIAAAFAVVLLLDFVVAGPFDFIGDLLQLGVLLLFLVFATAAFRSHNDKGNAHRGGKLPRVGVDTPADDEGSGLGRRLDVAVV